ncbi:ferric citrate transporter FecA [Lysobacteraceae bacterium NML120232]|nr:ferric citrate transporter FecA [Xanthomonadaceae bacterium NML120232]
MKNHRPSLRFAPLSAALLLAISTPAFADAGAADNADARLLDLVRVIANPEDPQTTMGSAYELDLKQLQKFNSANANDILRTVPGVYTREESGMGQFPRIGIRASSAGRSDRITVLVDGLPAAMAPYANTSAYFFPNIGRMSTVEVLKGPEVLLHGPQTTSGVVNMISTQIPEDAAGMLNVEIGSFGTRKIHAHYGQTQGQWGWLLETYQAQSDGFHQIDRHKDDAGYDISEFVGKVRWSSAADATYPQQLELSLNYDREELNVSYLGLTDADFRANPDRRYGLSALERMDRGRKSATLRHQIDFGANTQLHTAAFWFDTYRYYNRLNQINGVGLGGVTNIINTGQSNAALFQGILDGSANTTHANGVRYGHNHPSFVSKGIQSELHHIFGQNVQHELIVGARWEMDNAFNADKGIGNSIYQQVNGSLVYQSTSAAARQEGDARAWSFWAADRIKIDNLYLMPIVRHERIRTRANLAWNATPAQVAARNQNSLNKTTVGLGANYAIDDAWTLLGGIHQGFAPPGNGAGMGTRGEESLNYEGGVRWRNGGWGVDAIGFYTNYRNSMQTCLVANPCPGGIITGTLQTGRKKVYGLELGTFGNLHESANLRIPLRLAYTLTDGEYTSNSDTGSVMKGDVIEYTPKHVATVQLGFETAQGWNSYLALNYQSRAWTGSNARRPGVDSRLLQTDSLFTVNFTTGYALSENTEVYARVNNLFDQQRITHRGADGARGNAPREYTLGLRVKF